MTNPGQTHWPGCATDGGPAHYECALDLIARAVQPWLDTVDRFGIEWPPPAGIDHAMRAACAEIARLRALTTPQPIETAPRDRPILGVRRTDTEIGRWRETEWWASQGSWVSFNWPAPPTHWRPLPEDPK